MTARLALYADPAFRSSAGIERYTSELIHGLAGSHLGRHTVLLCTRREWAQSLAQSFADIEPGERPTIAVSRTSGRLLRYGWSFAGVPPIGRLIGAPPLVTHSPVSVRIPGAAGTSLLTVHDVHPNRAPELMARRDRVTLTRLVEARAVRSAGHIVADSAHTASDIVTAFGRNGDEVTIIPLGVDHAVFRPNPDAAPTNDVMRRYGLRSPFILYVGSMYSRKLGLLLEAYRRVSEQLPDVRLALVGGREATAQSHDALGERLRHLELGDRVVRTGPVPDTDLPVLMSSAEAFVYVSFYEGFGLSVLEAMACGAAVIAADNTSLPAIVGDAGLLVSPSDDVEIAIRIKQVLEDRTLRDALRQAARKRAQDFSWDRTVGQTIGVYDRLIAEASER